MKCIVGLGNIGKEYDLTRHNMGFFCVDYLCNKYDIKLDKKRKKCIYGEGTISGVKVSVIKPTTFMNLSGEAIVEIMQWYKIKLDDLVIIYDDIDLPFGSVRYRESGSAGTHNGMRNIIENVKSEGFSRIRVGIENRKDIPIPLIDYVLTKFKKEEIDALKEETMQLVEKDVLNFLTK